MRPVRNKWPDTELSSSVMFVAQLLRKMLAAGTYESFRVSTLDVRTRLMELSFTTSDVLKERIPIQSLDPCLSELEATLRNDETARSICPSEIDYFLNTWASGKRSNANLNDLSKFLPLMHRKLSSYKVKLEAEIIDTSKDKKLKDRILSLTNSYCSTLINQGYAREFIAAEVEERFFKDEIKKVEKRTLQRFLQNSMGKSALL